MNSYVGVQAQINGTVRNARSGELLDGATIFINNSSWQTVSSEEGNFILTGIHPGFFELVVYKRGYDLFQSSIRVQAGNEYRLNLSLTPKVNSKRASNKKDVEWDGNYNRFLRAFLGDDSRSDQYRIDNTDALQFEVTKEGTLLAKSDIPLLVENQLLGYTVNVYLQQFITDVNNKTDIKALVNYQPIDSGDPDQQSEFEINRLKQYWGSLRHFLQTIVSGSAEEDGFMVSNSSHSSFPSSKLVSEGLVKGYFNVNLTDSIKVSYAKDPGHVSFFLNKKIIEVNEYGLTLQPNSILVSGSMEEPPVAKRLPINYFPSFAITGRNVYWKHFYSLQEKIAIHTDRDYYYPRETIWFKAYLISSDYHLHDSLSKTVYVDLFSPEMNLIDTKSFPVESGVAWGDFNLNDSLPAGQYYLRAYTNWMRNFGDSTMYIKALPVLSYNQNIVWHEVKYDSQSNQLQIDTDQPSYHPRQKAEIRISTLSRLGMPVKAQLSISVVDGAESVELWAHENVIPKSVTRPDVQHTGIYFDRIRYFMEPGITIQGVVRDPKGNPTEASLEIVDGNNELISMKTNREGKFVLSGFNSRDSMDLAIMAFSKKGRQVESIEIIPRDIPPLITSITTFPLKYRNANALQRIQNTIQFDDAIVLQEVVVKSTPVIKPVPFQTINYGPPDQVVKGDLVRFAGPNLLLGLKGRVPGLVVTQTDGGIFIRLRGQKTLLGNNEPLILVDGTPLPDAGSVSSIDPYSVDRVEIINRAVPIYGSRGVGGMIAIYTKTGIEEDTDYKKYIYKIPGYDKSNVFYSPDYSVQGSNSPDFRTTIYWKPDVITDENGNATVTFYTADLATRYRIVVEGITEQGELVRAVKYITVE